MQAPGFQLLAVVHLPPLPGSPRYEGSVEGIYHRALAEASALADWGFDGLVLENYGDAPFLPGSVGPETIAVLAACAARIRQLCPGLALGVNVLRCDPLAALAVALAGGADFIRVNVHAGARLTDQGILEGRAYETLRRRAEWRAGSIRIFADAAVKHSHPLAPMELEEEISDLRERALADAILITGPRTGSAPAPELLSRAKRVAGAPVFLASGLAPGCAELAGLCDGALVSSCLREGGRAGAPLDPDRVRSLLDAVRPYRRAPVPTP